MTELGVLGGGREAGAHLLGRGQADGDAAPVVAVVGLGDHRVAQPLGGAHGAVGRAHELLARHRQALVGEDLVRLFLVAGQFHRDVAGAPGDRGLDALLELAVAELDQALFVQPQPGDVALLGGLHQRRRGRPERAPLRVADELLARFGPLPPFRHDALRAQFGRQQRTQQPQRQFAGLDAFVALRVLVHHRVDARSVGAARLAEGDVLAGDVLQFDGHVLEDMPEPGAVGLAHAPDETARLAVRAAVLLQARKRGHQAVDIGRAEPARGPVLEWPQVQQQPDDREVRMQRRADIDVAFEDAHAAFSPGLGGAGQDRIRTWGGSACRRRPAACAG
jgi:hypothetical protein